KTVGRRLLPTLAGLALAGKDIEPAGRETLRHAGKCRFKIADIDHGVRGKDQIVIRSGSCQGGFQIGEDEIVVNAARTRRLDHARREINPIESPAGRQILERLAHKASARAEIKNAPRWRQSWEHALRERAHM